MKPTIGIAGCSAEGAALCYRTICSEGARILGSYKHPQIVMHTPSLDEYVAALERGDLKEVACLLLNSAKILSAAGADFLICPDNTIHAAMPLVRPESPLPWLHIAEVVADEARRRRFNRVAILGTRWLCESEVYPEALKQRGISFLRPEIHERAEVARIIMEELVSGEICGASLQYMEDLVGRMRGRGCDAVVLGCTELPIVLNDENSRLPVLDSTRLLAKAAVAHALTMNAVNEIAQPGA
jgi:aspartate racemase